MPRRETRAEQYAAVAAFYGVGLIEDLHDARVPDFVIVHGARRAAHYGLTALRLFEQRKARCQAPGSPGSSRARRTPSPFGQPLTGRREATA